MWHFMENRFTGMRDTFHRDRTAGVLNAVESVVDGTDSKIRLVPGYKKKLHGSIRCSLEYADDLINQIPLAIDVSSSSFTSDPYVNAFFTNVTDLQSIFSHSSEVQDYMETCHDSSARCCALLCMHRSEKTVMGIELSGNILKKDVMQTAVSFSDHRVYSPAPSETEAREGLKNCLFQGLVTNALEQIVRLRLASHQLQSRHQTLHARLRHYKHRAMETEPGTRSATKLAHDIEDANRKLGKAEEQLMNNPLLTPQIMLQQVLDVFSKPDDFVQVRKLQLRLNKMGIKISEESAQANNKLNLIEVIIGDNLPRVITLATFPRKDLLARTVFSGF
jgi:hypothetical protein